MWIVDNKAINMANKMQCRDVRDCGMKTAEARLKEELSDEEDWPDSDGVNIADSLLVVIKTEECGDSSDDLATDLKHSNAGAASGVDSAAREALGHVSVEPPQAEISWPPDKLTTADSHRDTTESTLTTDHHSASTHIIYPQYTYTPYLSCKFCDYQCTYKSSLHRHMAIHTGDKPYSCTHCDCKFVQKSNLDIHMRTHTGDKPYPCKHCDRRFAQKSHLDRHMRTHTGDRPYTCKHCDYKFTHKSNLDGHMRTHTGEKPYSCKQCDYKCALKANLERHMHTHTGLKPFSCEQCSYKSAQKASLNRHMKIHTGERPFSCVHCAYKCALKANLDRHMQTHGEVP